jgi:methyl-accepting chemotaxis protein
LVDYLVSPPYTKVDQLNSKKAGDRIGTYFFDENKKLIIPKNLKSIDGNFLEKELIPNAPNSFFTKDMAHYLDQSGNLYFRGTVKSRITGFRSMDFIKFYPNKIINAPLRFFLNTLLLIILIFAIIIFPLLIGLIKKYISPLEGILEKLQSSSLLSKKASSELETTSTELAEASIESSSGMENISKSMEKINEYQKFMKKVVANSNIVHEENLKITNQSEVGNIELVKSITEMSQAAENIESITDIIEDISFQTNLLSLNASVEAARAGEQGKGFGVVAGSIRELSGKTSESAKEISELISEAIKKSKNGSVLAKENSDTINKILNNISKSLKTVKEVNENLEGQSKSLDPLSEGITQMSNIAKVSTTKAIACNKISKDLAKATVDMDQIISSLGNILKGGD